MTSNGRGPSRRTMMAACAGLPLAAALPGPAAAAPASPGELSDADAAKWLAAFLAAGGVVSLHPRGPALIGRGRAAALLATVPPAGRLSGSLVALASRCARTDRA
jgi:hypothetical protein